jgi:hypothetical protein
MAASGHSTLSSMGSLFTAPRASITFDIAWTANASACSNYLALASALGFGNNSAISGRE